MRKLALSLLLLFHASLGYSKTLTVAVIDTGIDPTVGHLCKFGHKNFVAEAAPPTGDIHGHGTHVAGLIVQNAGDADYCLVNLVYYTEVASGKQNLERTKAALRHAINIKVNYINYSGGGPESNKEEEALIKEALDAGIKVVVAAGNEGQNLDDKCDYYPACYDPRLIVVGNLQIEKDFDPDKLEPKWKELWLMIPEDRRPPKEYKTKPSSYSNKGKIVDRWEVGTNVLSNLPGGKTGYMSGTSQATGIATGKLIRSHNAK